jgi:hypothetical protein
VDELINIAIRRDLTPQDVLPYRLAHDITMHDFCDRFARRLAERYLAGEMSWPDGDMAANHVFGLITRHCHTAPAHGWSVYLAFDEGEKVEPGGDNVTRPLLEALRRDP